MAISTNRRVTDATLLSLVPPHVREIVRSRLRAADPDLDDDTLFEERLVEVLKYLYLISSAQESRFVPLTEDADNVWHELILQTVEYHELCAALPGRSYIHHTSESFEQYVGTRLSGEEATPRKELLNFFVEYVQTFGPPTSASLRYWTPMIALVRSGADMELLTRTALGSSD